MAGLPDRITEVLEVINSKDGMASKHYFERMNATLRADYPAYEFWSNPAQNLQSLVQALACSDEQLQMCVDKLENKFKKRDFLLFWLDLAIDRDDPDRIDQILHEQLEPDFQHLGYRKKLRFHLNRKDIEGFLASFKHIKKRERILPETLNTIEAMVELVSAKMGTEEAKNFLLRKKVISAAEVGLYTPALLFGRLSDTPLSGILAAAGEAYGEDPIAYEHFLEQLYRRLEKDADQEALLDLWEEFASGLDKKLKIKGSPHKLWSEALFRVGRRQIERRNFGKAETIIRTLGRSASGKALKEMIGEATQS